MSKRILRLTAMAALALSPLAASAADATPTPKAATAPDTVLARAKGLEVKRAQLDEALTAYKAQSGGAGRDVPAEKQREMETTLLDRIIVVQLLNGLATDAEKTSAKESAEKIFAQIRGQAPTPAAFEAQLKAAGLNAALFQKQILEKTLFDVVLQREVGAKVTVGDDALKKFYEDNAQYFERPEQVRASHVLLGTLDSVTQEELSDEKKKAKKATAEQVLARAKKGEDFAALAKEFSEDPGSKDAGGEYTFPRGQMVKEFEEAAFSLKPGDVSDIVTTKFGYHIIKLSEKLPAGKEPFDRVRENIKQHLVGEETKKRLPDFFDKVKKEAGLEILDPTLVPPRPAKS